VHYVAGLPRVSPSRIDDLNAIAAGLRRDVIDALECAGHEHRGHPGASLSIVDLVTALYFDVMRIDPGRPAWPDRDRFVLSKGHGCMALYAALARRGFFDPEHLRTFRRAGSILQGHPDMRKTPGVDMTSGSLGHGLSAAVGLAIDARVRRSPSRTFVILGDGELQEGLVWEGAMAAAKYALDSLVAFVDCNALQSSGRVDDIMPIEPLADKWRAFGWQVETIDGHEMGEILAAAAASGSTARPTVVLARTVKGKGVAYMEGDNRWHQACPTFAEATVGKPSFAPEIGNRPGRRPLASCRAAFGDTVLELFREGRGVMAVTSDTRSSMGLDAFAREAPDHHVEVGIAEQNLMTVAAGLAAGGRTVFAATYATFASMRAVEQIRTFLAYPRLNVVVVAGLGGLTGGIEGVAHLALEDLGMLRCIPDLVILNPADAIETRQLVRAAADHAGPVYIRLGRDDSPIVCDGGADLTIGPGRILAEHGWYAALMTSGLITAEVLDAAATLSRDGIACAVIEFPTIKPIDHHLILRAASRALHLFTIEEHSVVGGLGGAVADVLAAGSPARLNRIGTHDVFLESGSPPELRAKYGLDAGAIVARVRQIAGACPELRRPSTGLGATLRHSKGRRGAVPPCPNRPKHDI
jgi:transketolase